MFQTIVSEETEQSFTNDVIDSWRNSKKSFRFLYDNMPEDSNKWDLAKQYTPNHAAIWNRVSDISKKCHILSKNSKMAFVVFLEDKHFSLYRLEDLSPIN